MNRPRLLALLIAAVTPAIAFRLGGLSLWTGYAAGMTLAAALAAYVLWQDELLADVIRPKGLDATVGLLVAGALFAACWFGFNYFIAPAHEAAGLLRKCDVDGVRLPRLDARGFTAFLEYTRERICRGYGQSLGLVGPMRGVMIVAIAALEEFAWRGGVQQMFAEKFGSTRGWVLASVLYALAQLAGGNPVLFPVALAGGFAWGALYRYRKRLVPAVISHAVFSYFLFHAHPLVDFR